MALKNDALSWAAEQIAKLPELARQEIARRNNHPCRQFLYHQRMVELLSSKMDRHRVVLGRSRLRFHRWRRRHWEAKCTALNTCEYPEGC